MDNTGTGCTSDTAADQNDGGVMNGAGIRDFGQFATWNHKYL